MSISGVNSQEARIHEAEKQANDRIQAANERAREAEKDSNQQIDQIRDNFVRQSETEQTRQETAAIAQQNKSYETLRNMQREMQNEVKRSRQKGEKDLTDSQEFYKTAVEDTTSKGERDLQEQTIKLANTSEYQRKTALSEMDLAKQEHSRRMQITKDEQEAAYTTLSETAKKEYQRLKETTENATSQTTQHYRDQYQKTLQDHATAQKNLQSKVDQEIAQARLGTSDQLAAYSSRQNDPFYKLQTMEGQIDETNEAYIVSAKIPEHEQDHISVAVRGNQIVLSGRRQNQESIETAPGKKFATSSFQSYSETFPIRFPVDERQISRQFDGNTLMILIPKKGLVPLAPHQGPHPDLLRAERPKLPENLPPLPGQETSRRKNKASETLT